MNWSQSRLISPVVTMTNYTGRMPEEPRFRWLAPALLIAIVAIGAYLRALGLSGSLWLDELHTAWTVTDGLADVLPRAMAGNQPPVPYWFLWFYTQLFGVSEWSLRAPTLVASSLAIVAVYAFVRDVTKSHAGALLAAFALALHSDSFAFYGSEARVYALGQCLAILHVFVFNRLMRQPSRFTHWLWIGLGLLLFYVHYTLALLLVAELVAWLALRSMKCSVALSAKALISDFVVFGLGCLPAVTHLRSIAARRENWDLFIERPEWNELLAAVPHENAFWWLVAGWLGVLMVFWWKREPLPAWSPLLPALIVLLAWLFVPIIVSWTLSRTDVMRLFYPRYLVFVFPASGALLGMLAAAFPAREVRIAFALAAALTLAGWNVWLCHEVYGGLTAHRDENWRDAVAHLNERAWQSGEPLFVVANLIECEQLNAHDDPALQAFCLYPLHAAYRLHSPGVVEIPLPMRSAGRLSPRQLPMAQNWLQQNRSFLVVVRASPLAAERLSSNVIDSLDGAAKLGEIRPFGGVSICEILPAAAKPGNPWP